MSKNIAVMEPIAPTPAGWNKTTDDLFRELERGERLGVGRPEMDWAIEYERSLIPATMRFPRMGDVYEALAHMSVDYMTAWAAPYTGGGKGVLKRGERVVVHQKISDPKPIGVYAKAVDYAALEARMVPPEERTASRYGGFYFSFTTVDLNTKFRLVHEE